MPGQTNERDVSNAAVRISDTKLRRRKMVAITALGLALAFILASGQVRTRAGTPHPNTKQILFYVDPMHPEYKSDKPGIAPDCGMALVPVYSAQDVGAETSPSSASSSTAAVHIDVRSQQLFGIRVARVSMSSSRVVLRKVGRVAAEDSRTYRINAGADGYVKEVSDVTVGDRVKKDQRLAVIYSPEFLPVAGGFLSANERAKGNAGHDVASGQQGAGTAQNWLDRLRNLGMTDTQITEITSLRKVPEDIYVNSPVDGVVLSRSISLQQRFERYMQFYTVADLGRVWITVELFGNEADVYRPGLTAKILAADGVHAKKAEPIELLPQLDPSSHAYKARMEVDNQDFELRPDMFVEVEFSTPMKAGITVSADAVVKDGNQNRVYVQREDGSFESRQVNVGATAGDGIEIVGGLQPGESIVVSGTFLVDAEARLNHGAVVISPVQNSRSSAKKQEQRMNHRGGLDD